MMWNQEQEHGQVRREVPEQVPMPDRTDDTGDLTMEAPVPERQLGGHLVAPAPAWSPPAVALLAWVGAALAPHLVDPAAAAVAGAAAGWALGRAAAGWPSGGLLVVASWTIGGIGAGTAVLPTAGAAACAWWDVGLLAVTVSAVVHRGPSEVRTAWWRWPGEVLAALGLAQLVARWWP